MKPFTTIAIAIFSLICLVHILRLVYGLDITIGGWVVPRWVSAPGAIITGGLAYLLWKERH